VCADKPLFQKLKSWIQICHQFAGNCTDQTYPWVANQGEFHQHENPVPADQHHFGLISTTAVRPMDFTMDLNLRSLSEISEPDSE